MSNDKNVMINIEKNSEPGKETLEAFKEKMYAVRSISHTIRALVSAIEGALYSTEVTISGCNFTDNKGDKDGRQPGNKSRG